MTVTDMQAEMAAAHQEMQQLLSDAAGCPDVLVTEEWTVHQMAAHVGGAIDPAVDMVGGKPSPIRSPADLAAFDDAAFARWADEDLPRVARGLGSAVERYLQRVDGLPPDTPVPYHLGLVLPVQMLTANLVSELLLHGRDIAGATGLPFTPPEWVAAATLTALVRCLPRRFKPDAAPAALDLRLRIADQPGVLCHVADGGLTVLDDTTGRSTARRPARRWRNCAG